MKKLKKLITIHILYLLKIEDFSFDFSRITSILSFKNLIWLGTGDGYMYIYEIRLKSVTHDAAVHANRQRLNKTTSTFIHLLNSQNSSGKKHSTNSFTETKKDASMPNEQTTIHNKSKSAVNLHDNLKINSNRNASDDCSKLLSQAILKSMHATAIKSNTKNMNDMTLLNRKNSFRSVRIPRRLTQINKLPSKLGEYDANENSSGNDLNDEDEDIAVKLKEANSRNRSTTASFLPNALNRVRPSNYLMI